MSFLTNPYVYGMLIVVATAALVYAYQHTVERDAETNKKSFYKTLAAGTVSAMGLAYFLHRPEPLSSEPFIQETNSAIPPPVQSVVS